MKGITRLAGSGIGVKVPCGDQAPDIMGLEELLTEVDGNGLAVTYLELCALLMAECHTRNDPNNAQFILIAQREEEAVAGIFLYTCPRIIR